MLTRQRRFRRNIRQPEDPTIRYIALTQDQIAVVSACDYEWLMQWNWCAHWNPHQRRFYAVRGESVDSTFKLIHMHRFIMGMPDQKVDHFDRDGLNNRRGNLRAADNSQSQANRSKQRNNKSGFKGVHQRDTGKYVATIAYRNVSYKLGEFVAAIEAAVAYDLKAIELHGEFAALNFPRENYLRETVP